MGCCVETKIRICDDCKNKVKEFTCEFCSKDLCKDCTNFPLIVVWQENVGNIITCKECYKKMQSFLNKQNRGDAFGEITNNRIRQFILGELRKLKIMDAL